MKYIKIIKFCCLALVYMPLAFSQQTSSNFVSITSVQGTFEGGIVTYPNTATQRFNVDVDEVVTVSFQYRTSDGNVVLLEDGEVVAQGFVLGFEGAFSLSYTPSAAGLSTLTVAFPEVDSPLDDGVISDSIQLRKVGTTLNIPLPDEVLPAGSRFFLNSTSFVVDGFIRQTLFWLRGIPFEITERIPYRGGDKVLVQDRIYQVMNDGGILPEGSIAASGGLQTTDPSVLTNIAGIEFRYIGPNLVDQLDYHEGDYVLSNGRLYQVTTGGRIPAGGAAQGLQSSVESDSPASAIVEFLPGQVGFLYSATPVTLQQGLNLVSGSIVSSGGRYYEALNSGTITSASPEILGTNPNAVYKLDGIDFRNIFVYEFRSGTAYQKGDRVFSNGSIFEVTIAGTVQANAVAGGLAQISSEQFVDGQVGFSYVASAAQSGNPEYFPRQYHKYQRIDSDSKSPYATRWGPEESIDDPINWFGPGGYLASNTVIELYAVSTDSRFINRRSQTVPVVLLPRIDPGAVVRGMIIQPQDGRTVAPNTELQLSATAQDITETERVIQSVQFYVDGVAMGPPDLTFPYTFPSSPGATPWRPQVAGTYTLNVVVIDDKGNRTISPDVRVNVTDNRPKVRMTNPAGTFTNPVAVFSGETIIFEAFATGSGGVSERINSVEFYSDGNLIASGSQQPGGFWTGEATPNDIFESNRVYTVVARVSDVNGLTAQSDPIFIRVVDTLPPTVSITSPSADDVIRLNQPEEVTATASASETDLAIVRVEFFVDGQSIGVDTTSPFSATFTPTVEGTKVITVVATDSAGVSSSSTVEVLAISSNVTAKIIDPIGGTLFSPSDNITVEAAINPDGRIIQEVRFLANGTVFAVRNSPPFRSVYSPETSLDALAQIQDVTFTVRVIFKDGVSITSPGVSVNVLYSPLDNASDFVSQAFQDLFIEAPSPAVRSRYARELNEGALTEAQLYAQLLSRFQGQNGVSVVGAYETLLARLPTVPEYQAGQLGTALDVVQPGTGTGTIPISVGETVTGTFDNFFDVDRYSFSVTGQGTILTARASSSLFMRLTFRDSTGGIISQSADGFYIREPSLTATFSPGNYILEAEAIGSGIYTLSLVGTSDTTPPSSGGSTDFVLNELLNQLFASQEYLTEFGPLPDFTGPMDFGPGDQNRRAFVNQLYRSKYNGNSASDMQQYQGSIRMFNFGGHLPFTANFITEAPLTDGSALIFDAPSKRNYWTTATLIIALFNENPTPATINEFNALPLLQRIEQMLADPRYRERFDSVTETGQNLLFPGSPDTAGWVESWIGWVNISYGNWYFHDKLGWLFANNGSNASGVWLFSPVFGWVWTNQNVFHWLYSNDKSGWQYYDPGSSNPVWFYDFNSGQWNSY